MGELKTKLTDQSVAGYLDSVEPEDKKIDAKKLDMMLREITGEKPRMWGTSIVGYGMYHYKSERSTQEGDWPLIGFSPRKQALSLYVLSGFPDQEQLLKKLGKHSAGRGCLYIKRLSDVDDEVLLTMFEKSFEYSKQKFTSGS
jgi:hypothetical protein